MPDLLLELPAGLVPVELYLTSDMPRRVAPRLESLGDVFLAVDPEGPAFRAERTWRHIAADPQETLVLAFLDAGEARIQQGEREILLRAGDLVLLDTTRPYTVASRDMFATRQFQFPKALLGLANTDVSHLTGTQLRQGHALSAFLVPYLSKLAQPNLTLHPDTRDRLVHDVTDILATLIGETMREVPLEDAARRTFVMRVKAFVEAHLGDASLSPELIATAHGISVRYLHKVFQAEGISVGRWILHARLERCRRILAESDNHDISVSDVCHSWGFISPAHFSRAFHAAYGMSPKQWQIQARARRR